MNVRASRMMRSMTTTSKLARHYLNLLASGGYRPEYLRGSDGAGALTFEAEGDTYSVLLDEADQDFFAMALLVELGELESAAAVARANDLNNGLMAVKVAIDIASRVACFQIGAIVGRPLSLRLLERARRVLKTTSDLFFESLVPAERIGA